MNINCTLTRCLNSVILVKPVEEIVESLLPENGIFIKCSVGDRAR